jgi:hypothetical protein
MVVVTVLRRNAQLLVILWLLFRFVVCFSSSNGLSRPLLSYNSRLLELVEGYQQRHRRATSDPASGVRYIISTDSYGGVGNTLPGLVSAFFLALVTNRTLLVESLEYLLFFDHKGIDMSYESQVV